MRMWWRDAARLAATHRRELGFVVLLSLLSIGLNLLLPWPIKIIIDHVLAGPPLPGGWTRFLGEERQGQLIWLAAMSACLFLLVRITDLTKNYLAATIGRRMQYELGGRVFSRLQALSPLFHARSQAGDLVRRVAVDSKCVDELLVGICIPAFTSLLMLIAMFAIMLSMSVEIAVLALLIAFPIAVLVSRFIPHITQRSLSQQNLEGQVMSLAETNLSAMPIVHAFDRMDTEERRFRELTGKSILALSSAAKTEQHFGILVGCTIAAGTAVVMAVGSFEVVNGRLEVGSLLVMLTYLALLYAPVETLARLASAFSHSAAKGKRAFAILSETPAVRDGEASECASPIPTRAKGGLRFENVSFGYEPGRGALRSIDVSILPGERIAIVGATGAGKSTLVSLALRLFDPDEGRITLDGVDLKSWKLDHLRRQFGLVLQDPFLLPLTVQENIAFGLPEAGLERVAVAACAARADAFIQRLPQGYATSLGEYGSSLSGGERQRIAIARALVRNAPVLIFDEPSSALDIKTEQDLLATIYDGNRGRTTIVIAHRLSTVRAADRILVLGQGRIVEAGTHIELVALGGLYSRLHSASTSHVAPGSSPREAAA